MNLFLIILFVIFITFGPLYGWFRNIYRHFFRKRSDFGDRSIKGVGIVTFIIGISIGFMAIFIP